ncbi:hypothetical protein RG47T_2050 [Mucilaginibacter polytrichastri]|uniref:Uncharacterized protein n=1 Tax=Mucilaginibacter polytrichastri TaxID=1302689 RepID=A0A1Q5ZXU0_9SPHI|nr:hypothetical protein RG47T_2050 [Mucilaginibacter polytrichastri]
MAGFFCFVLMCYAIFLTGFRPYVIIKTTVFKKIKIIKMNSY